MSVSKIEGIGVIIIHLATITKKPITFYQITTKNLTIIGKHFKIKLKVI